MRSWLDGIRGTAAAYRSFNWKMLNVKRKPAGTKPVPAPRQRGSLDRVLVDAAMDLFASYGYRGTSLSRIARAAGVTKGALYWHFSDKEEFFLAVMNKVLGEWSEPHKNYQPASNREEFVQEFLWLFENMAVLNEKNPWVSRLLLIITLESHKISPRVLRAMRRFNLGSLQIIQELLERGSGSDASIRISIRRGRPPRSSPAISASPISGTCTGRATTCANR